MTIGPVRIVRALAVTAAISMLLTGCVSPPVLTPVASSSAEPILTESPIDELLAPWPYLDVSCDDVVSEERLWETLHTTVARQQTEFAEREANRGPLRAALRQVGGFECEWSNGELSHVNSDYEGIPIVGGNDDYEGVAIKVLPAAHDEWLAYISDIKSQGVEESGCYAWDSLKYCTINSLASGAWIEISVAGKLLGGESLADPDIAVIRPLYDEVVAALAAASPASGSWAPPEGALPLTDSCDQLFAADDVRQILGLTTSFFLDGKDDSMSLDSASWWSASAANCPWITADMVGAGGGHRWLPGGAWAWEATLEQAQPGRYEPLAVPGLMPDDAAFIDCPVPDGDCTVDLTIGHNWIQIGLSRDKWTMNPVADKRGVLEQLAALAVVTLRG
jgi:hypothetical protein